METKGGELGASRASYPSSKRRDKETGEGKRSLKEGHWSRFQIQRKTRKKYKGI